MMFSSMRHFTLQDSVRLALRILKVSRVEESQQNAPLGVQRNRQTSRGILKSPASSNKRSHQYAINNAIPHNCTTLKVMRSDGLITALERLQRRHDISSRVCRNGVGRPSAKIMNPNKPWSPEYIAYSNHDENSRGLYNVRIQ
jgi:hypothetical protein